MLEKLGDFIELKRGYDLPSYNRNNGEYPIISSAGITEYHNVYKVEGEGVVTGRSGTIGEVFFEKRNFWPLNTSLYVKDFKSNNKKFVYYFLKNLDFKHLASATAVPSLDRNILHSLRVLFIKDNELQKKIGNALSNYDNLIANNNKRIKLLENMAEEIYKEWFVRLRFPNYQNTKIIDGIPNGWELSTIGKSVKNFDSKRKPLSKEQREKVKGKYPYYGASSILDYVNDYIFDGKYLLLGEDGTVITKKGTPMLQFIEGKFWVSNHAHVLIGQDFSTEYLYLYLNSFSISGYITGTAQPKINQENLNSIKILIPSEEILKRLDEIIIPIFNKIKILEQKKQNLKQTRDLLLPRLISGKLNIEDLDIK